MREGPGVANEGWDTGRYTQALTQSWHTSPKGLMSL